MSEEETPNIENKQKNETREESEYKLERKPTIRAIHCAAEYSEKDNSELVANIETEIQHIDSSFNYTFSLIDLPDNLDPASSTIRWISLSKFFEKNSIKNFRLYEEIRPVELVQKNRFGYLNTIQILTHNPCYLERILGQNEDYERVRAFSVKLNIGGVWTKYIIDDFVPVLIPNVSQNGKIDLKLDSEFDFIYSGFSNNNGAYEIWTSVLEKAYAKAYGGYFKLKEIPFYEAFTDFTGIPGMIYRLFGYDEELLEEQEQFRFHEARENEGKLEEFLEFVQEKFSRGYTLVFFNEAMSDQGVVHQGYGYLVRKVDLKNSSGEEEGVLVLLDDLNQEIEFTTKQLKEEFNNLAVFFTDPEVKYNAVHKEFKVNTLVSSVVKIKVQEQGHYTLSLNQKSRAAYLPYNFSYNSLALTFGRILDGDIAFIKHSVTKDIRENIIDLDFLEEGSYFAIIDAEANLKNYKYEGDYEEDLVHWRDVVVVIQGTEFARLDSLALEPNKQMIYDYLVHRVWKNYAKIKRGEGSKFDVEIKQLEEEGGEVKGTIEGEVELSLIDLPNISIYKLENLSENHIEVRKVLKEKLPMGLECFGPFEVNNIDPWALVNAKSYQVMVIKFQDRIAPIPYIELNTQFDVTESEVPQPEDYFGEDPYEYLSELHTVQPSRTFPAMTFSVPQSGILLNNIDLRKALTRNNDFEILRKGEFEVKDVNNEEPSERGQRSGENVVRIKGDIQAISRVNSEEDGDEGKHEQPVQESTQLQSEEVGIDVKKREGHPDADDDKAVISEEHDGDFIKLSPEEDEEQKSQGEGNWEIVGNELERDGSPEKKDSQPESEKAGEFDNGETQPVILEMDEPKQKGHKSLDGDKRGEDLEMPDYEDKKSEPLSKEIKICERAKAVSPELNKDNAEHDLFADDESINDEISLDNMDDKTKFEYVPSPKFRARDLNKGRKKSNFRECEPNDERDHQNVRESIKRKDPPPQEESPIPEEKNIIVNEPSEMEEGSNQEKDGPELISEESQAPIEEAKSDLASKNQLDQEDIPVIDKKTSLSDLAPKNEASVVNEAQDTIKGNSIQNLPSMPQKNQPAANDKKLNMGPKDPSKFCKSRESTPIRKSIGDVVQFKEKKLKFHKNMPAPMENIFNRIQRDTPMNNADTPKNFFNPFMSFSKLHESPKKKKRNQEKKRFNTPRKAVQIGRPICPPINHPMAPHVISRPIVAPTVKRTICRPPSKKVVMPPQPPQPPLRRKGTPSQRRMIRHSPSMQRDMTPPIAQAHQRVNVIHYSPSNVQKIKYVYNHPHTNSIRNISIGKNSRNATPTKYVRNNSRPLRHNSTHQQNRTPSQRGLRAAPKVIRSPSNIVTTIIQSPSMMRVNNTRQSPSLTPPKALNRREVATNRRIVESPMTNNGSNNFSYKPPIYIPPPIYVGTSKQNQKQTTFRTQRVNSRSRSPFVMSRRHISKHNGSVSRDIVPNTGTGLRRPEQVKSPLIKVSTGGRRVIVDGRPGGHGVARRLF